MERSSNSNKIYYKVIQQRLKPFSKYDDDPHKNNNFSAQEGFNHAPQNDLEQRRLSQYRQTPTNLRRPTSAQLNQSYNSYHHQPQSVNVSGVSANVASRSGKKQYTSIGEMMPQAKGLQCSISTSVPKPTRVNSAPIIRYAEVHTSQPVSRDQTRDGIQPLCNTYRVESVPQLNNGDINVNEGDKRQMSQSLRVSFDKEKVAPRRNSRLILPNGRDYLTYQLNKDRVGWWHEYIAPAPSLNPKNTSISTHFQKIVHKPKSNMISHIMHAKRPKDSAKSKSHSSQKSFQALWDRLSALEQGNEIRNYAYSKRLERYEAKFESDQMMRYSRPKSAFHTTNMAVIVPQQRKIVWDVKSSASEAKDHAQQIKEQMQSRYLNVIQEEKGFTPPSSSNTFIKYSAERFTQDF